MTLSRRNSDSGSFTFTGRHMLAVMIAFFGVVIVVNATMAVLASKSWTGLVVKNSYVASQKFNEELEAARKQKALGWKSDIAYSRGVLSITLADKNGEAVILDGLFGVAGRPTSESQDRSFQLAHRGRGTYSAYLYLDDGIWDVRVAGSLGDTAYRRDLRLQIDGDEASLQ